MTGETWTDDACSLVDAFRRGERSPREELESTFTAIEKSDLNAFSKRMLVQRIIRLPGIHGGQLIAFGDGYVEIEEVKLAGGVTVGVATDEPECRVPDPWKRQRLIGVGADYIIPNFLCRSALLPMLFATHEQI